MILRQKVMGSMPKVAEFEVNHNRVYVRKSVTKVETEDFNGWEYAEQEMTWSEYLEQLRADELENRLDVMQALAEIYEMNLK